MSDRTPWTDETVLPALTPEQWANWKSPDGLPFEFDFGNPHVTLRNDWEIVEVPSEGIRPLIALLVKAWSRGCGEDLWTHETVRALREANKHYKHFELERLAQVLAALLPPETGSAPVD